MSWSLRILLLFIVLLLISVTVVSFQLPASFLSATEIDSPGDWIKEEQIKVYQDKVVLQIPQTTGVKFADTNSMDPFLDTGANALEIKPESAEAIKVGDVISYKTKSGTFIHRVVDVSEDKKGKYFLVKGDNNAMPDLVKVRFTDIEGVLVAVIY